MTTQRYPGQPVPTEVQDLQRQLRDQRSNCEMFYRGYPAFLPEGSSSVSTTKWESFSLTQFEREKLTAFFIKHSACDNVWMSFSHSSGIGVNCKLKCVCGEEQDVTDYAAW